LGTGIEKEKDEEEEDGVEVEDVEEEEEHPDLLACRPCGLVFGCRSTGLLKNSR
jgi:hypothetical protein